MIFEISEPNNSDLPLLFYSRTSTAWIAPTIPRTKTHLDVSLFFGIKTKAEMNQSHGIRWSSDVHEIQWIPYSGRGVRVNGHEWANWWGGEGRKISIDTNMFFYAIRGF